MECKNRSQTLTLQIAGLMSCDPLKNAFRALIIIPLAMILDLKRVGVNQKSFISLFLIKKKLISVFQIV